MSSMFQSDNSMRINGLYIRIMPYLYDGDA